jgi:hypothetical protein
MNGVHYRERDGQNEILRITDRCTTDRTSTARNGWFISHGSAWFLVDEEETSKPVRIFGLIMLVVGWPALIIGSNLMSEGWSEPWDAFLPSVLMFVGGLLTAFIGTLITSLSLADLIKTRLEERRERKEAQKDVHEPTVDWIIVNGIGKEKNERQIFYCEKCGRELRGAGAAGLCPQCHSATNR